MANFIAFSKITITKALRSFLLALPQNKDTTEPPGPFIALEIFKKNFISEKMSSSPIGRRNFAEPRAKLLGMTKTKKSKFKFWKSRDIGNKRSNKL